MGNQREPIPGLPKQQEWKVLDVREGKEEPGQKGGMLKKFYVDFEGCPDTYWRRKMPAEVKVGESYYGTISNGDYGPIFKKEAPGGGGGGGGGGSRGGSRSYKPESEFDPEKTARIGRSHAQGMALRYLQTNGETVDGMDELVPIIDWFEEDVSAAAAGAKPATATATQPPAPSAAQAPPPSSAAGEPGERDKFRALFEAKALDPYPAGRLADFVMRLSQPDRVRAWNGLGQLETEMDTLKELEQGFTQHEGEPLPTTPGGAEDDIPF